MVQTAISRFVVDGPQGTYWKSPFSLRLRVEPAPGDPSTVSLPFGPLVLTSDSADSVESPTIIAGPDSIESWLHRAPGDNVRFQSSNAVKPRDYAFLPFSEAKHLRTATYFKLPAASG